MSSEKLTRTKKTTLHLCLCDILALNPVAPLSSTTGLRAEGKTTLSAGQNSFRGVELFEAVDADERTSQFWAAR